MFNPTNGIVTLHTRAGASVTKGQLLAQIDSPELRSRLAQELATLRSVQSSFEQQKIALRQASREREQQIELLEPRAGGGIAAACVLPPDLST